MYLGDPASCISELPITTSKLVVPPEETFPSVLPVCLWPFPSFDKLVRHGLEMLGKHTLIASPCDFSPNRFQLATFLHCFDLIYIYISLSTNVESFTDLARGGTLWSQPAQGLVEQWRNQGLSRKSREDSCILGCCCSRFCCNQGCLLHRHHGRFHESTATQIELQ